MNLLDKAIVFATERHSGSVRKGTQTPYIVHPLEAVSISAGITNDIEILCAAVLHDVVEDTSTQLSEIETIFGKRIAKLVAAESEDKMPNISPSESWKLRKQATIHALQSASLEEKILVLSDKLSNLRAIHRDYYNLGDKVWDRFNQKDRKMHEWYYRSVADAISDLSGTMAYRELRQLITETFIEHL
jgi:(p)ppGpp synthase/HD superfamily hydrolase